MAAFPLLPSVFLALLLTPPVYAQEAAREPNLAAQMYDILNPKAANKTPIPVEYDCPDLYDPAAAAKGEMAQGLNGWFFRETALEEDFETLNQTAAYMAELRAAFKAQGSELIFFLVPPRAILAANQLNDTQPILNRYELDLARNNFARFIKELNAQGGLATTLDASSPVDDFFYKRDFHWKPKGARESAQHLAELIKVMPFYDSITPGTFKTNQTGEDALKSDMGQKADRLCAGDIPAEPYPIYQTIKELGEGADALFGDSSDSGLIVLLGTSYSDGKYNFEGFLSEYTGMDVANFAISGGGLRNAMISYVTRPPDKRLDPNVIIWESLTHYDVNQADYMFRQAIPAVAGECSEADALLSGKLKIEGGEQTTLFEGVENKRIAGEEYVLFFEASNPAFVKMTVEFNHADGDGEWFPIDRSWRYNNTKRFFIRLSDALSAPLESVNLLHENTTQTEISYRLCRASEVVSEGKTAAKP